MIWSEKPHDAIIYMQPIPLMMLVFLLVGNIAVPVSWSFAIHSAAFFFTALLCHGELDATGRTPPGSRSFIFGSRSEAFSVASSTLYSPPSLSAWAILNIP